MKTIKAYLENQKELAYIGYANSLQKESVNLLDSKHFLERIVHLELLLKELNNGKEKREKA
jgi:hypothetical protein